MIMKNVVIVEDNKREADVISNYLHRYGLENGTSFQVTRYCDALTFLAAYKPEYDIVFLDIEMPGINGVDAARKLREADSEVAIIFVTNMVQFAVNGYEVGALDFIVKPVEYYNFSMKMHRAMRLCAIKSESGDELTVQTGTGLKRIKIAAIKYIEVLGHHLLFHTFGGETDVCGSLKDMEEKLRGYHFSRCNNCYLVNLKYVSGINGASAISDGEEIQISRRRKKSFVDDLTVYLGDN